MKKYIIPIDTNKNMLNNIRFKEPLIGKIEDDEIKLTYKSSKLKNRKGIYFKGRIVEYDDKVRVIGDFHYSKFYIALICIIFSLLFVEERLLLSREFGNMIIVNISIFAFIYFNIKIRQEHIEEKTNIIQLFISSIDNKDNRELDISDYYKDTKDSKKRKTFRVILCTVGVILFFLDLFGVLIFGLGSVTKNFEISKEYSPLYEKEDFLVDNEGRYIVKCSNYTEVFNPDGKFLMKINHGREGSVYVETKEDLLYFLVYYKGGKKSEYYNEFVVDISKEEIVKHNTYKEDDIVFVYDLDENTDMNKEVYYDYSSGSTKFKKGDTTYKIKSDKISVIKDNKKEVIYLNSPKWPPYFGDFFIGSFLGVACLCYANIDNVRFR